MTPPFVVLYDACVLYPAPLRDLLMRLGLSGRFRAQWSAQIHAEWKRNLLKNRPDLTMVMRVQVIDSSVQNINDTDPFGDQFYFLLDMFSCLK
jgi:hypothetical protein